MIRLKYAKSYNERPTNFGDGLSPIIIQLLTGDMIKHSNFDEDEDSLVSIGTILQNISEGNNTIWGTGIDTSRGGSDCWVPYKNAKFRILSVRGRLTQAALKAHGIECSDSFGDPAILLTKFLNPSKITRNGKLALIPHLSQFEDYSIDSRPKEEFFKRIDPFVEVINPLCSPNPSSVMNKVNKILSSSYVLSSSLHGLILAEAYGIPCAALSDSVPSGRYSIFNFYKSIDPRVRDFYSGINEPTCLIYGYDRNVQINTREAISFIQNNWKPCKGLEKSKEDLLNSFPYKYRIRPYSSFGSMFFKGIEV